jgi:hypothetical protein
MIIQRHFRTRFCGQRTVNNQSSMLQFIHRWISVVLIIITVSLVQRQAVDAQSQQTPSLDLLIALDVSGSMDVDTTKVDHQRVDMGWNRLRPLLDGQRLPATDPSGIRYAVTQSILEWLAQYNLSQDNRIEINATVLAFSDVNPNPVSLLLDWTALRRDPGTGRLIPPLSQDDRLQDESTNRPQQANFIALYDSIEQQFARRTNATRRAVLVVTDSVPCYPDGVRDNQPKWDPFCDEVPSMVRHINGLPSTGISGEYIFFANALNRTERWAVFDSEGEPVVRQAWENRLRERGAIIDLDSMNDLAGEFMNAILREIALAQGLSAPEDLPVTQSLPPQLYEQLGVSYSTDGTFEAGPYQSSITVMAAPASTDLALTFLDPDEDVVNGQPLFGSENQPLQLIKLTQPAIGEWSTRAGSSTRIPTWALYRPAEARLRFFPPNPRQYQPQQLVYELLDEAGELFEVSEALTPDFTLTLSSPGSDSPIELGDSMQVDEDGELAGKAYISAPFLPLQAGPYRLNVAVEAGANAAWSLNVQNAFLMPANLTPSIQVDGVRFVPEFTIVQPEDSPGIGNVSNVDITMPRSLPLDVSLQLVDSQEQAIALPEGLEAQLEFETPANDTTNACPQSEPLPMPIVPVPDEDYSIARQQLRLETSGECNLRIELSLQSSLQPVTNSVVSIPTDIERTLIVTSTQRLQVQIIGNDNQPLPPEIQDENQNPDFVMEDREPTPFVWDYNTLVLRVEVTDEDGDLVNPVFAASALSPDRSYCQQPLPRAEATADQQADAVLPGLEDGRLVPFILSLTNEAEQDVAREQGICLYATDSPGVYLASLRALAPGNYDIRITGNRVEPALNFQLMEYAPTLFENDVENAFGVSASLRVNSNPLIALQFGGAALATIVIVLGTIGTLIRWRQKTVAPLHVSMSIYQLSRSLQQEYRHNPASNLLDNSLDAVWKKQLEKRNSFILQPGEFVSPQMALLNIERLELTSKREATTSRERSVYVTLKIDGGIRINGEKLTAGSVRRIFEDAGDGSHYYLTNSLTNPVTARDLLTLAQRASGETTDPT